MEQQTSDIATRFRAVNENIQAAVKESPFHQTVRLMGASKYNNPEKVKEAYDCGLRHFGENYVDELVEKSAKLPQDIKWHFIGHLQSNKCKKVLIPNLECLETIDSLKLAEKMDKACETMKRDKLKVFIQIKTSQELTKSGIPQENTEEIFKLIEYIRSECKHLVFSGLMTIGENGDLSVFKEMTEMRQKVCEQFQIPLNEIELSMGMSADYQVAVKHGSTNVRVGTVLFGTRQPKNHRELMDNEYGWK